MNIDKDKIANASGIDALYYFAQSGAFYEDFYLDLLNQIEDKSSHFKALNFPYQDSDIVISINGIDVKFSGKGRDGFLWFHHNYFRIGFKDNEKNKNINDICIQLNAIGIYTIGITSLVEYINKEFLKGILLKNGIFPITRIDVNMFIQHNFSYLTKEMVVSKKQSHETYLNMHSNAYELETYKVGEKPFKLRIYNKLKELKKAPESKKELMYNYFGINGLNIDKPIFNVEFEMSREFLKQYGITTIDEALTSSKRLFELGCELIKFVDISTLTQKQIDSPNRRRASLLPIWEFISKNYNNDEFIQMTTPLERIEKISYRYTLVDAVKPFKKLMKRLMINNNTPTPFYFIGLLEEVKNELNLQENLQSIYLEENRCKENLKIYCDDGLREYHKKLESILRDDDANDKPQNEEIYLLYLEVDEEMTYRGLQENPF